MPALPSPEVHSLITAIETFMERPPRDLPDGAIDKLNGFRHELKGYAGNGELSPGEKEAIQAATGTNEAQPYAKAATGADAPSPGQKEYEAAIAKATEVLSSVGAAPPEN